MNMLWISLGLATLLITALSILILRMISRNDKKAAEFEEADLATFGKEVQIEGHRILLRSDHFKTNVFQSIQQLDYMVELSGKYTPAQIQKIKNGQPVRELNGKAYVPAVMMAKNEITDEKALSHITRKITEILRLAQADQ